MSFFVFTENRAYVAKAKMKAKAKASPNYHQIDRLSKRMANQVQVNLLTGIKKFKNKISIEAMQNAVKTGSFGQVMETIPWRDLPEHLAPFNKTMNSTFTEAAAFTLQSLPPQVNKGLRFDMKNPSIRKHIDSKIGERIVDINSTTQKVVQQAVIDSLNNARTPRWIANQIKDSIGLDERRANALSNYRENLETAGDHSPDMIDNLVEKYSERLLDSRAMTIGRTEARDAANNGQLSVWKEATSQGLLDKGTTKKVWIVDGNPCDICEPMDGIAVGLEDNWDLNNGDSVDVPSDSHPNCYCGMELEFVQPGDDDYTDEDAEDAEDEDAS